MVFIGSNYLLLYLIPIILIVCLNFDFTHSQRVKLTDIQTLTLTKGLYTTGRRLPPVLQLKCMGGTAGCRYAPDIVQCYNRGNDGTDVQWECKAELDEVVKFGSLKVNCEGFDYNFDTYVLAGSCGLEYTLEYRSSPYYPYRKYYYETSKIGNLLTLLVMIIVVLAIYKSCTKFHENHYDQYAAMQAQIDPNDPGYDRSQFPAPPPPYGFRSSSPSSQQQQQQQQQQSPPGFRSEYIPNTNSEIPPTQATNNQQRSSNPFGGFWTGAAAGGLAGYMFGRSTCDNTTRRSGADTPPPAYESDIDDNTTKTSTGFATTTRR